MSEVEEKEGRGGGVKREGGHFPSHINFCYAVSLLLQMVAVSLLRGGNGGRK